MDCKDCKCYVFPRNLTDCKEAFGIEMCEGCGLVVCSSFTQVVSDVPKSIREKFFVQDFREHYIICENCYKNKYKGEITI